MSMSNSSRLAGLQHALEAGVLGFMSQHHRPMIISQGTWHVVIEYGRWPRRRVLLTVHTDRTVSIFRVPRWWRSGSTTGAHPVPGEPQKENRS